MPISAKNVTEITIKERKRQTSALTEIIEDRTTELLEMVTLAITQTSTISLGGLRLKPCELNAIKDKYPHVEYRSGLLFLKQIRYVLPRKQKSLMVIEEGNDKNLWEEWRKIISNKPRKGNEKDWLKWLYDNISPCVMDVLLKDITLLYTKKELAQTIRFCRYDIVDEKEFNYIIYGLIDEGLIYKKKITLEEGYDETYYGLTKKGKELKKEQINNEPLNTPATQ